MITYSSSLKQAIKQHVLSLHEEKKPFKCEVCDYIFTRKGDLKKHFGEVHQLIVKENRRKMKYVIVMLMVIKKLQ